MRASNRELLAVGLWGGRASRFGERIEMLLRRGREFSPRASLARVISSALVLFGLVVAGSVAPRWIALAQARPAFEVASVKLWKTATGGGQSRVGPQGITIPGASLVELVAEAYQIPYSRISTPQDPRSRTILAARYEVAARANRPVSRQQLMLMLQTLLEDRFKLALHSELQVVPVYKLAAGKNGPKLQESVDEGESSGVFQAGGYAFHNTEMWRFCAFLSGRVGRPVVDQTGISGKYDFILKLDILEGLSSSDPDFKRRMSDWGSSSIFTDIQKQLGLKLEADKSAVDYLVIDHVEQPSEN